ncbi:MAG: hypothetical protein ACPGSM_14485 [Thiolinea sp.]
MQSVSSRLESLLTSMLHRLTPEGCPIPHNSWQRMLSGVVRKVVPAPHKAPMMEWEYGTWTGSFAGYDEVGRQLGEANVLPEWLSNPLNDKWSPFKGPGSRQGQPFNVDAFREMGQCWPDLLLDAAMLRDHYVQHYLQQRIVSGERLSARDLFVMASVGVSVPGFLLRRGDHPVADGQLPRQAAAGFKVIGGMYAATSRMVTQAHPMLMQGELDADEFLAYLEAERLLLSPEARACAAPERMIREILAAITDPDASYPVDQGLQHIGRNDVERAIAYGVLCAQIDVVVLLHWRALKHCLQPLIDDAATPDNVRVLAAQEEELEMQNPVPLSAFIRMAQHVLPVTGDSEAAQEFLRSVSTITAVTQCEWGATYQQCMQLENAMRLYVKQQQTVLDKILCRDALAVTGWSPAPGSDFLKRLLKVNPQSTPELLQVN